MKVKNIITLWFIVKRLFLIEGCYQLLSSLVIFPNTESRYLCLKLWSTTAFQLLEAG